jgi:hypothetical protein
MMGQIYILSGSLTSALPFTFCRVGDEELPDTYFDEGPGRGLFRLEDAMIGGLVETVEGARPYVTVTGLFVQPRPRGMCGRKKPGCIKGRLSQYVCCSTSSPKKSGSYIGRVTCARRGVEVKVGDAHKAE